MDYYTLVNVRYFCKKCDKNYSKLMNPKDSITCDTCGQKFCQKIENKKKKRVIKKENIRRERNKESDGAYRLVFGRDSTSHNRTNINDRNLNNIYGDADSPMEEEKAARSNNIRQPRRPPSGSSTTGPSVFERAASDSFQFSNSGMSSGLPPRFPGSRESNRQFEQPFRQYTSEFSRPGASESYSPYGSVPNQRAQQNNSRGEARRRIASPAVIFHAFFTNNDPTSPVRGFSISTREIGGGSDSAGHPNFFTNFGIFNNLFQELVGDIFNQESFLHNFNSNFQSSDIFQDIINQSAAAAQEAAKKPTAKAARKKLATVKIGKVHCKKTKDKKLEEPSCTICITEIPLGDKGLVLPCGHIFHPDCINPWLDEHNTCPTCRHELPAEKKRGASQAPRQPRFFRQGS